MLILIKKSSDRIIFITILIVQYTYILKLNNWFKMYLIIMKIINFHSAKKVLNIVFMCIICLNVLFDVYYESEVSRLLH